MAVKLLRTLKIAHLVLSHRLLNLVPKQYRPWYVKFAVLCSAIYPKAFKAETDAYRLRVALESLGPVWIKLGQMLSTRRDILSDELAIELAKLQDRITPFSSEDAIQIILSELQIENCDALFESIDSTPLATASIAQVHSAKLKVDPNQTADVVIKVIRPGIEKDIYADLKLMKAIANMVQKRLKNSRRYKPQEVVKEYEKTILQELDLKQEAANGIKLRQNFENSDDLYIPYIYQDISTQRVLIMERIDGIPVSNIDALIEQGSNLESLASRGVRVFFTQVFRDSFFHADMHPGNIFISKQNPNDPKYIGLDFGIVGTLNEEDKRYLAENFVAFFNRDYNKVAKLHVQSGWVPSHINVEQFEQAIRTVCDPIFNKPLAEISFGQVLVGLFDTARQFEMQVQPQLVLLQKTLLYVEGLGRQLYPQLDLWKTAKPFLEDWINEQMGLKAFVNKAKSNFPYWIEKAPELPELVHSSMTTLTQLPDLQKQFIEQYKTQQQSQQRFFTLLAVFMSSSLSAVATALLADLNQPVGKAALFMLGALTLVTSLKLYRSLKR
jgi:ubiquinone biosynthesis protein